MLLQTSRNLVGLVVFVLFIGIRTGAHPERPTGSFNSSGFLTITILNRTFSQTLLALFDRTNTVNRGRPVRALDSENVQTL